MPGLVKLNIFMPATTDTPSSSAAFNREQFWYRGFYYLYGIDHKFNDGQFTQDLHMISLPNDSLVIKKQQADITECGSDKVEKSTASEEAEPTGNDAESSSQITKEDVVNTLGSRITGG